MEKPDFCPCPYVPCQMHGNCKACVAHSRNENEFVNCMEPIAIAHGTQLTKRYPPTLICSDPTQVALATATDLKKVVDKKPDALICLPAGGSAVGTFEVIIQWVKEGKIDLSSAKFVQLDEWVGLPEGVEDCGVFMDKNLYSPAGIKPEQICKMNPRANDLGAECKRIDDYIKDNGQIDWMLLGLGMNGHVALNEPNVSWYQYTFVVDLDDVTKEVGQKYFSQSVELTRGMTIGMKHIFETRRVVLQVFGEAKVEIVKKTYETAPIESVPGTVMALLEDRLVILDKAAASKLSEQAKNTVE